MQPIYNELIQFWKDNGCDIPISEGTYWLDNGFIKAFTPDGVIHKLYKYKVSEDLKISITRYKDYIDGKYESWIETAERMKHYIQHLVDESLEIIRFVAKEYDDYDMWCLTSTGKDSTVTLDLVRSVIPEIKIMFNNTSLDVADTYKIVKRHPEWIITNPKEGFYQWTLRRLFIPTRMSRACCGIYKEGASIEYFKQHDVDKLMQFMGVRNDESLVRADREFIDHNPKWSNANWKSCQPIRKWDDLSVWLYMIANDLEINPKYRKGYSRVGCAIACPYYTKTTWVLDKYWYPNLYKRWHARLEEDFLQSKRWNQMNCTISEYHKCWNGGLYRQEPTEEVIQEMMLYRDIKDRDVALQYFNKTCDVCGKNIRQKDVIGMNLKVCGRKTEKLLCKKHLMEKFDITKEQWNECIETFKAEGCCLF